MSRPVTCITCVNWDFLFLCLAFWSAVAEALTRSTIFLQPVEIRLRGCLPVPWVVSGGGYFPGSSPQNPERGIEIHFARQNGAAFIHRASNRSKRYPVTSTVTGDQVLILFGANSADEGRFTGSFVRENLLRGNYTNPSRGENYPLDLSLADGTGLAEVQGGAKSPGAAQVVSGPYVTLRLDFQAKDGFGSPNRSFSIHYGLGFATDREGGGTRASWKLVGGQSSLGNPGAEVTGGLATTSRLVFYPDWVVLDAFGHSNFNSLLSLELPRLDLVRLSGANLAEDASSVEAGQNKVWQVVDLALSYDSSPIPLDIVPLLTSAQNPKNQTVVLSGQSYQVPDNMFLFLSALPGPPFPP